MRFRRNDHSERLNLAGGLDRAGRTLTIVVERKFTEVHRPSIGRDSPKHIRQIFRAKTAGGRKIFELGGDADDTALTLDGGFSASRSHKRRSPEINFCGAAAMKVIHRSR